MTTARNTQQQCETASEVTTIWRYTNVYIIIIMSHKGVDLTGLLGGT